MRTILAMSILAAATTAWTGCTATTYDRSAYDDRVNSDLPAARATADVGDKRIEVRTDRTDTTVRTDNTDPTLRTDTNLRADTADVRDFNADRSLSTAIDFQRSFQDDKGRYRPDWANDINRPYSRPLAIPAGDPNRYSLEGMFNSDNRRVDNSVHSADVARTDRVDVHTNPPADRPLNPDATVRTDSTVRSDAAVRSDTTIRNDATVRSDTTVRTDTTVRNTTPPADTRVEVNTNPDLRTDVRTDTRTDVRRDDVRYGLRGDGRPYNSNYIYLSDKNRFHPDWANGINTPFAQPKPLPIHDDLRDNTHTGYGVDRTIDNR